MKKDVIYVDIEDDITSIIEKVKNADAKIVALVPPKRVGVLQSIVNLKLLQRAANSVDKRIVMITSDASLASLAAGVAMPVAKNLQTKPELAPVTALAIDDEDVINGEDLPIGDHAASAGVDLTSQDNISPASSPIGASSTTPVAALAAAQAPKKGRTSIPNFDSFRKKLFIFGGLALLLIVFGVWALLFAPRATVNIVANTTPYNVSKALSLSAATPTLNAKEGTVAAVVKELQKTASVDFSATGKKEIGEKASGSMTITRNGVSDKSENIPVGTGFSSGNFTFTTTSAVVIPASKIVGRNIDNGSATVNVIATTVGEEYNLSARSYQSSIQGYSGAGSDMTGGSKRQVTVVSEEDVAKAKEKLTAQDAGAVKTELKQQFEKTIMIIDESFVTSAGDPVASPAVGQEATAAKLTAETKYSIVGIARSDAEAILTADITSQLAGLPNQKIYDTGINKVRFGSVTPTEGGYETTIKTVGYVGPNINSDKLAEQLVGKRSGEIQAQVLTIDGVESVDAQFSPFWVSKAPAKDKITIKFTIKNETN